MKIDRIATHTDSATINVRLTGRVREYDTLEIEVSGRAAAFFVLSVTDAFKLSEVIQLMVRELVKRDA